MKILVPVKRVVDYNVKVRAKSDESGPDLSNAKMAINPFCEIAIEEAVRIKEAGKADEVIAVSVGDSASQEQLRTCLALGADRAILVETDEAVEPLGVYIRDGRHLQVHADVMVPLELRVRRAELEDLEAEDLGVECVAEEAVVVKSSLW